MNWSEVIQIMLTGIAAVGSLLCLAVLLGIGRQLERSFAGIGGGELETALVGLESREAWSDRDDRSD